MTVLPSVICSCYKEKVLHPSLSTTVTHRKLFFVCLQFLDTLTALCLDFQEFCEHTEHVVVAFIKQICIYPHCSSPLPCWLPIPCCDPLSQVLLLFLSIFPLSQILIVVAVPLAIFLLLSCFNNITTSLERSLAMLTCD